MGILTVARSFWVSPLSCRPFMMSFATSIERVACFSSSLSWSSLAVFSVVGGCLLEAAPSIAIFFQIIWYLMIMLCSI